MKCIPSIKGLYVTWGH